MTESIVKEFLNETSARIKNLFDNLHKTDQKISEEDLRLIFRLTHTVKGNSQIFGLRNIARFSTHFENLLQALNTRQIKQNADITNLIKDCLRQLSLLCNNEKLHTDENLLENLKHAIPAAEFLPKENLIEEIPEDFLNQLSEAEINLLKNSLRQGEEFTVIEAFFDAENLSKDFKRMRNLIEETGRIIAVAPAKKFSREGKTGFSFFLTGNFNVADTVRNFDSQVVFSTVQNSKNLPESFEEILQSVIYDCENQARNLKKTVEFQMFWESAAISKKNILLLKDVAIHLIRNAVDHAIEMPAERIADGKPPHGTIKIRIQTDKENILLKIEDDGRGINPKKISGRAREKGLIPKEKNLTVEEAAEIIFTHGFSTAEKFSATSGRGVGLDAVKESVESCGGKIIVKSKQSEGTSFEIYLPQQ